jgi:cytochrome P450
VGRYVLSVTVHCIMGFSNTDDDDDDDDSWWSGEGFDKVHGLFREFWNGFLSLPINIPGTQLHRGMKAREELDRLIMASIDKKKKNGSWRKEIGKKGTDSSSSSSSMCALEIFLEEAQAQGVDLTPKVICDFAMGLLAGGTDTSTTTLLKCIQNLCLHPEVLGKVEEEQNMIYHNNDESSDGGGGGGGGGGVLTMEMVKQMRYTEAVIKETTRLAPTTNYVFRKAKTDFEVGGRKIYAGETVYCCLGEATRTDARWGNAHGDGDGDMFRPERWLESSDGDRQGAWLQFSTGPHSCIGERLAMTVIKVMLAVLVRGFVFGLVDPEEKIRTFPFWKPVDGMPVWVVKKGKKEKEGEGKH